MQKEIVKIYHANNGTYGYRMIADKLALRGIKRSYPTIYRYMDDLGLKSIIRRKKPGYVKAKAHKVFPDLLQRNFNVDASNKVWLLDFSYLPMPDGITVYNCTIIDLHKRNAVATLNSTRIDSQLAIDTLTKAINQHKPSKGLILHSDQGSQLTSRAFVEHCRAHKIQQSMSRAGCPGDNSPMERFFNTFKHEFFNLFSFKSIDDLNFATYDFVNVNYNYLRPHRYNNGIPPSIALRKSDSLIMAQKHKVKSFDQPE